MRLPASLPSRDTSPYPIMDLRGVHKYPMEAEDRREHTAFTHAARRGTQKTSLLVQLFKPRRHDETHACAGGSNNGRVLCSKRGTFASPSTTNVSH